MTVLALAAAAWGVASVGVALAVGAAAKLGRGSAWINSAPTSPPSSSSRSSPASCS